jgi:hypothetical protein
MLPLRLLFPSGLIETKESELGFLLALVVRRCPIRTGITFELSASARARLEAIIAAPASAQKHVWRARIILMISDGSGTVAIMEATGKSKTCVWRWQERFMTEGVDGLLHDKSRPPGITPLDGELVERVV